MMNNLVFLSAVLLSSTIYSAAGENVNGLRGALNKRSQASSGTRDLKMGMMKGAATRNYELEDYDDDYETDDYYYSNGKGKGKGDVSLEGKGGKGGKGGTKGKGKAGSSGKSKKGMSKSKKGKGGGEEWGDDYYGDDAMPHDDFYPTVDDINFLDDQYFDDKFFEDDDCELVTLNETFTVPRASRFLAPDTTPDNMGDPTLIGTVFIWEDQQVFEPDGEVPIVGTRISGTCTRTTATLEGMGSCQLIFVDDDEYTINVDGLLTGPFGSSMAIVGGTGGMVGVIGEMDFFPIFTVGESEGDIFINVTRYEVEADLGLIVCPSH